MVIDLIVQQVMLDGLENRFAEYNQPALLITHMLNPHRQQNLLNADCDYVSWRNVVILVAIPYRCFPWCNGKV